MSNYEVDILKDAHKHSIFHLMEICNSSVCGCFYCLGVFAPDEIHEWTDEEDVRGKTALCPKCTIDSVIGSASGYPVSNKYFLQAMYDYWF